jgi:hypothetical protein
MGIRLKYTAKCDRCGEIVTVYGNCVMVFDPQPLPTGWSRAIHSGDDFTICSECTQQRQRLDNIHRDQLKAWYGRSITSITIDFLEIWTEGILTWIRISKKK